MIETLFGAWDKHASQISFIGFLWMHDLSASQTEKFITDYNAAGFPPAFGEYLRTCGMRTYSGADKKGWKALSSATHKRAW